MSVCIVGRGKVGRTLAHALGEAGVACQLVAGRGFRPPRTPARTLLLAVPDGRIRELAESLAPSCIEPGRGVVLHCAGARSPDELSALAAQGIAVGVMHPLISFAEARHTSLAGATITTFGAPRAVARARQLARKLGARCVAIEAPGPAYHAAAALVANGASALAHLGARVLVELGFSPREAERALARLLASVSDNVAQVGVPSALTGPVVRGDVATVSAHLDALGRLDPGLRDAYASVLPAIVASARAAGLDARTARKLLALYRK